MPLVSPRLWLRRAVFWSGAILVALAAIGFAQLADAAQRIFAAILAAAGPWSALVVSPAALAIAVLATRHVFPGAQGSGIPQVIAALHLSDRRAIADLLSLRIAFGKVLLTLLGLAGGASIGREGPTVQVGAAIMHALGARLRLPRVQLERGLVLAGGAAGIAAAFNTPLAGLVFAIEELSRSFETRTSGNTLTAVVLAGITSLALLGNYAYFGVTSVELAIGPAWAAVPLSALVGGLAGGLFSALLVAAPQGLPGALRRLVLHRPVAFAALCGLVLAVLGLVSDGATYGTGYAQARALVEGHDQASWGFPLLKLAATAVSYLSGIPGGLFAPSLSVGAGLGHAMAPLLPGIATEAAVLLGMVAYFAGVVQAPITAAVIVLEMTSNPGMTVPLMATSLLAFLVSRLVCRRPLYSALAQRFLVALDRQRGA
jgi:H+/Cl- antiporter ClcA